MDQRIALSVLCPYCGALEGDECWGPAEHTGRYVAAAYGGTDLAWWPEFNDERIEQLVAMPYRDYLASPEWAERRDAIRQRAHNRCEECGATHRLQVHHATYQRRGYEWPSDLKLLCDPCHTACHADKRLNGASVSYGAYVQACLDERRRQTIGTATWDYAAVKYASDNFSDYPENTVIAVLREMHWPDRPVRVSEVLRELKERVTPSERERWIKSLDDESVEAPA